MDFDPDGIAILAVYKFNSANLSHEPHIAVPSIKWLGIQSCDILPCPINSQSFMSLSTRDRKFATNFMQKHFHTGTLTLNWKNELQIMLMLNIKAEIQILGGASVLSRWLDVGQSDSWLPEVATANTIPFYTSRVVQIANLNICARMRVLIDFNHKSVEFSKFSLTSSLIFESCEDRTKSNRLDI
ncbi:meiosis-specific topoisomerase Spo11 [Blumeria hordei DH14]|uniref:Meiosis-specific topoisomerase Spo11 n=1 Tax=Blumeria graminis f. sp. hordei (strain DH14) TaxID=546991 RepID=N1JJ59_BLUG1|nr:meiosis-specific topoisomerase Spo11 [Blumeria hordei DH14]